MKYNFVFEKYLIINVCVCMLGDWEGLSFYHKVFWLQCMKMYIVESAVERKWPD